MVDGTGLENQRGATHREFESRPLRQEEIKKRAAIYAARFCVK